MYQSLSPCRVAGSINFSHPSHGWLCRTPLCPAWGASSNGRTHSRFSRSIPSDGRHSTAQKNPEALKTYPARRRLPGMVCRWSKLYGEDRAGSQILALSAGATGQMWIKERRTESFAGRAPA